MATTRKSTRTATPRWQNVPQVSYAQPSKFAKLATCINPERERPLMPDSLPGRYFSFHLDDGCWAPVFCKNDLAVIDTSLKPRDGDAVAARAGNRIYLCRYKKSGAGHELWEGPRGIGGRMGDLNILGVMVECVQYPDVGLEQFETTRRITDRGAHTDVLISPQYLTDGRINLEEHWISGNIVFAENMGDVYLDGQVRHGGHVVIGEGTTLHLQEEFQSGGCITGHGSLVTERSVECHKILIDGDFTAKLSVQTNEIEVKGFLHCFDRLDTSKRSGSITAGRGMRVEADLEAREGAVTCDGDAHLMGAHCGHVKVAGNLHCEWWLISSGAITVGGDLTVDQEELRANYSITAGGNLRAGGRIFAGLVGYEVPTEEQKTVSCANFQGGTFAYGNLVETSQRV